MLEPMTARVGIVVRTRKRPDFLRRALDDIAAQLPRGYETVIGDGVGDTLSQGVMQRISLVRGLAAQSQFILFDEANSAIDGAGDAELRTLLEEAKDRCGIVLISHRPSLLKLADVTYEMKDGRITLVESRPEPEPKSRATPNKTGAGR